MRSLCLCLAHSLLIKSRIGRSAQFLLGVDDASLWDKSWDRQRLKIWRLPKILNGDERSRSSTLGKYQLPCLDIFCFALPDSKSLHSRVNSGNGWENFLPRVPQRNGSLAFRHLHEAPRWRGWDLIALVSICLQGINCEAPLHRDLTLPTVYQGHCNYPIRPCSHCKVFVKKCKRNNSAWVRGNLPKLKLARISSSALFSTSEDKGHSVEICIYISTELADYTAILCPSAAWSSTRLHLALLCCLKDPVKCSTG